MWMQRVDGDVARSQRELDRLLERLVAIGGSDLHVKAGSRPRVRLDGELVQLSEEPRLGAEGVEAFLPVVLDERAWRRLDRHLEADVAYSVPGLGRFRANVFWQRGSVGLVLHHLRPGPPTLDTLHLPDAVRRLADEQRGIVLVGGPPGAGAASTLAAIVDHVNGARECHIVTIEDPVEVLHADRRASISQREVGFDTDDVAGALRAARRQDADVIVVGALRDTATARAMLDAAAGCLVVAGIDASDTAGAVSGFVGLFAEESQAEVAGILALLLRGTICQRLVPTAKIEGRVPAVEIVAMDSRIRRYVADADRAQLLREAVAAEAAPGIWTFARSLCSLLVDGVVDVEAAMAAAPDPHELRRLLCGDAVHGAAAGPARSPRF